MTDQWPTYTLDKSKLQDAFQLAREFEIQCTKVYDHASSHPAGAASADYMMQFAAHAYQAVHSLYMQKLSSSYWDLGVATAELQSRALDYRKERDFQPANQTHAHEVNTPPNSQGRDTAAIEVPTNPMHNDIADEDEDEDEEDDEDWEESDEETDDEYYEYYEGSDADSDLEAIAAIDQTDSNERTGAKDKLEDRIGEKQEDNKDSRPLPSSLILQDQAMHDRITAALQQISIPSEEPEQTSLARTHTETQTDQTTEDSTPPFTDDTQSEATAVQTQSNQNPPQSPLTKGGSFDGGRLHRKISSHPSQSGIPRRLKTVCYKYIRRAMVPVRGKIQ